MDRNAHYAHNLRRNAEMDGLQRRAELERELEDARTGSPVHTRAVLKALAKLDGEAE